MNIVYLKEGKYNKGERERERGRERERENNRKKARSRYSFVEALLKYIDRVRLISYLNFM